MTTMPTMTTPARPIAGARRRGFSRADLLALLAVAVAGIGVGAPLLEQASCNDLLAQSAGNLRRLAVAHASYAADWNQRQFTAVRDDLGAYGGDCADYQAGAGCHPPLILGTGCDGVEVGFAFGCGGASGSCLDFDVVKPINFDGPLTAFGSFRLPNAQGFHEYVGGRYFDPTFFAPRDRVIMHEVAPLFGVDCGYAAPTPDLALVSSYCLSPAAMYAPEVFRPIIDGGFQLPDALVNGYASPPVTLALHPDQKTRMLEHHWLQNTDGGPCNPNLIGPPTLECQPWFFNHGIRSAPLSLFYDGHVRALSVLEASQSDERLRRMSLQGLWSRDTPFGQDGYLLDAAYDAHTGFGTSMHILTTDGIRGRDTLR